MEDLEIERQRLLEKIADAKRRARECEAKLLENPPWGWMDENYVQELEGLSDSEAAEHLRSVDEPRVLDVYVFFEYGRNKRSPATLAKMCFALIARSRRDVRLIGTMGLGQWLKDTSDRDALRELAAIVRDPREDPQIREAAYGSLLSINRSRFVEWLKGAPYQIPPIRTIPQKPDPNQNDVLLQYIEWTFVDFFL